MPSQAPPRTSERAHDSRMLAPVRPPSPTRRPLWSDPVVVALLLLLAVLLSALTGASFWLYGSTRVQPGVEVLGVELGGLTRQGAVEALDVAWQERQVVLLDGERPLPVPASELGLAIDVERTVDAALGIGDAWSHLEAVLGDPELVRLAPVVGLDDLRLRQSLERLAAELFLPAIDATIETAGGRAVAMPSATGRALDVAVTADRIASNLALVVDGAPVPLTFLEVPPTVADLGSLAEEANARLSSPLAIRAYDPIRDESLWWTPPAEAWADWLLVRVEETPSPHLAWGVNEARVRSYVEARGEELAPERYIDLDAATEAVTEAMRSWQAGVAFRVYHYPSQHIVQSGETLVSIAGDHGFPYPWLQQANPGVDALQPGQVIQIPSPDVLLPLPVVMHKRIVVSIAQQQMWAYEGGELIWGWMVSTGIASSPTAPGVYQVQYHELNAYASSWDLWMPHFIGIYRPVPSSSFMNGFHGFPTRDGVNLLWTSSLGHPVTYGCILLSNENAAALYEWAEPGVVVEIRR
jgi:lipoprotein-anchoring transpeptidase ErfK/SrfK